MIPENLHLIGQITKLHGFRGELTVFLDTSIPAEYARLEHLFLNIRGTMIPYVVESLEQKTRNSAKLKLQGVDSEEAAKALVKSEVYIERDELTEADDMRRQLQEMIGYRVADVHYGEVGTLHRLLELSGNPQLEIQHPAAMILLPLQEDFIREINHAERKILVEAPPGLIELFLEG
jgi:16S rRNA processing protein RimM